MSPKFFKFTRKGKLPAFKDHDKFREFDEITLYYFKLVDKYDQLIMTSEGYSSAGLRDKAIAAVKLYSGYDEHFERSSTPGGKWFYTLRGSDYKILGTSRMYSTSGELEDAIAELRSLAPKALIA